MGCGKPTKEGKKGTHKKNSTGDEVMALKVAIDCQWAVVPPLHTNSWCEGGVHLQDVKAKDRISMLPCVRERSYEGHSHFSFPYSQLVRHKAPVGGSHICPPPHPILSHRVPHFPHRGCIHVW